MLCTCGAKAGEEARTCGCRSVWQNLQIDKARGPADRHRGASPAAVEGRQILDINMKKPQWLVRREGGGGLCRSHGALRHAVPFQAAIHGGVRGRWSSGAVLPAPNGGRLHAQCGRARRHRQRAGLNSGADLRCGRGIRMQTGQHPNISSTRAMPNITPCETRLPTSTIHLRRGETPLSPPRPPQNPQPIFMANLPHQGITKPVGHHRRLQCGQARHIANPLRHRRPVKV
jgi:hypothetical protein